MTMRALACVLSMGLGACGGGGLPSECQTLLERVQKNMAADHQPPEKFESVRQAIEAKAKADPEATRKVCLAATTGALKVPERPAASRGPNARVALAREFAKKACACADKACAYGAVDDYAAAAAAAGGTTNKADEDAVQAAVNEATACVAKVAPSE